MDKPEFEYQDLTKRTTFWGLLDYNDSNTGIKFHDFPCWMLFHKYEAVDWVLDERSQLVVSENYEFQNRDLELMVTFFGIIAFSGFGYTKQTLSINIPTKKLLIDAYAGCVKQVLLKNNDFECRDMSAFFGFFRVSSFLNNFQSFSIIKILIIFKIAVFHVQKAEHWDLDGKSQAYSFWEKWTWLLRCVKINRIFCHFWESGFPQNKKDWSILHLSTWSEKLSNKPLVQKIQDDIFRLFLFWIPDLWLLLAL